MCAYAGSESDHQQNQEGAQPRSGEDDDHEAEHLPRYHRCPGPGRPQRRHCRPERQVLADGRPPCRGGPPSPESRSGDRQGHADTEQCLYSADDHLRYSTMTGDTGITASRRRMRDRR